MNLVDKTVEELREMLDDNYEEQKNLSEKYDDKIDELEEIKYNIHQEIIKRERRVV